MDTVTLRRAGPADAERLALVGQATFLESYAGILPADDILLHCARQHSVDYYRDFVGDAWLAEAAPGDAPVGYLTLCPPDLPLADLRPDDVEIKRIYLLHRFQGGGVGAALMQAAVDHARAQAMRRILLGVYRKNERALAFYARQGFTTAGERRFRVGAHEYEDLVLARHL